MADSYEGLIGYAELDGILSIVEQSDERIQVASRRLERAFLACLVVVVMAAIYATVAIEYPTRDWPLGIAAGLILVVLLSFALLLSNASSSFAREAVYYEDVSNLIREVYALTGDQTLNPLVKAQIELRLARLPLSAIESPSMTVEAFTRVIPGLRARVRGERKRTGKYLESFVDAQELTALRLTRILVDELPRAYTVRRDGRSTVVVKRGERPFLLVQVLFLSSVSSIRQVQKSFSLMLESLPTRAEDDSRSSRPVLLCVYADRDKGDVRIYETELEELAQNHPGPIRIVKFPQSKFEHLTGRDAMLAFSE